jgi:NhaP-type Na+/H+ or K+/H+ antiporter
VQLPGDALYLIGGLALLLGSVLPGVLSRRALSVPMIFVGVGVLIGLLPLPGGAPISPVEEPVVAERLTELCVIVALMGVGLAIDRPLALRSWASTWRLLAVGLPLFIALAAVLGWWWMGLAPAAALLLGAVLAPTDPVLAGEVQVEGPDTTDDESVEEGDPKEEVDEDDEVRFALTSEAGLNDGLAFPFVYAAIFLVAVGTAEEHSLWRWIGWELVGKVVIGAALGWLCGWLLARAAFRSRVKSLRLAETGEPLLALAATFAVYGLTELVGGYGFLAVFTCAVALRSHERRSSYHEDMHRFISQLEFLLTMLVLLLLGASLSWGLLADLTWQGALVAVVVVFVVRPLTAWLSLLRRLPLGDPRIGVRERRVVAFFGVRGVGTLYYLAYATGAAEFEGIREVWSTVTFAVLLSVVVHGVLATPVMHRLEERREQAGSPEPTIR